MPENVFRVDRQDEFGRAGPTDLIRLLPVEGTNPLFLPKSLLQVLVYSIATHEMVHLSGPTGSAKTSLLEALHLVPENFRIICRSLGFAPRGLKVYPVQMATYDAPGELYQRRALKAGSTYDEKSGLVKALLHAEQLDGQVYHLVWLREMGRVHSASVQGGLLDLMHPADIMLPDGESIDGRKIGWVADSNYQATTDAEHTLVPLDDALKRRFTVNLTLDYLSPAQEVDVLRHLVAEETLDEVEEELIVKVVHLGKAIRDRRAEGKLLSVAPPTIYGYLAFLRMAARVDQLDLQTVAASTMLGNASNEDSQHIPSIFNEVFGLQQGTEEDPTKGGILF